MCSVSDEVGGQFHHPTIALLVGRRKSRAPGRRIAARVHDESGA